MVTDSTADEVKAHLAANWSFGTTPTFNVSYEVEQVQKPKENTIRVGGSTQEWRPKGKGKEDLIQTVPVYIHTPTDGMAEDFVNEIRSLIQANYMSGVDFQFVKFAQDTSKRTGKRGVVGPKYQYTVIIQLESHSLDSGSPNPVASANYGPITAWSFVTFEAVAGLSAEKVLSMSGNNTLSDTLTTQALAAGSDSAYDIGADGTRYKKGWLDDLDATTATIGTLTLTNPLADASVANDITLTNLTQITTRTHASLQGIAVDDHHAKYTDAEARTAVVSDVAYDESTWDGVGTFAPSKNAVRDKIEAMISDTAYGAGWDGATGVAPSKNAVYDRMSLLALDTEVERHAIPAPVVTYANGATQSVSGAATNDIGLYPAADTDAYIQVSFNVPPDTPAGKTWYLRTVWVSAAADDYHFHWYVSIYTDGDAYGGWNTESNTNCNGEAGDNVSTTAAWERCEEVWAPGWTITAGDIVVVQLKKQSNDSQDLYLQSVELYWT